MTYYGADQQTAKVQQLAEKKAQLQAALPVVDDARAAAIEARLDRIDAALQKEIAHAKAIGNVAAIKAAMGIDGIGGLEFQAQAPAGVGRLVRLPFYPIAALTGNYEAVGTTVPVVEASGTAFGTAQNASIVLRTPQISWATLRIVGFETEQQCQTNLVTAAGAGIAPASTPNAKLVVSDLKSVVEQTCSHTKILLTDKFTMQISQNSVVFVTTQFLSLQMLLKLLLLL